MTTTEVMRRIAAQAIPDAELATRIGCARETLARWRAGSQRPSLDDLQRLAEAAGLHLEVHLEPAEHALVEKVRGCAEYGPTAVLKSQLAPGAWGACRDALKVAVAAGDRAVLIGPVAAALRGAPRTLDEGRVDVLVPPEALQEVLRSLADQSGCHSVGADVSPDGQHRREIWAVGRGRLTVTTTVPGPNERTVHDLALPALLNADDVGLVRIALAEDLLDIAQVSPWPEDRRLVTPLRAVLASGLYSSRKARS